MTPREAVDQRITELCGPYHRIERAPHGDDYIRIWFGPDCWTDLNREGFERALRRDPLPVDADGRIVWPSA